MMDKLSYENQGTNTYLVYQIGEDDIVDSMSLGMITNNQIAGLAPTVFTQMDTTKFIKYNVSAKITVKQFFTGPVNKRRLLGVFNGIVSAMLSAEDYMIDDRMILLDTDYIFADVSTCETVLICLPVQTNGSITDLGTFFKEIIFNTQFDQTENCDYVARIMNHLNSTPVFSLEQFKSVLDELSVPVHSDSVGSSKPELISVQQKAINQAPVVSNPEPIKQLPVMPIKAAAVAPQPVARPTVAPSPVVATMKSPSAVMPLAKDLNTQSNVTPQQQISDEKKISLFYLLQHYNNENAAAYKAQKEAKKSGNSSHNSPIPVDDKKKNKGKEPSKNNSVPFAIPGQPVSNANQKQFNQQQKQQPVRPIQQPVQPVYQQPVTPIPVAPQKPIVQQPVVPRPVQSNINFGETTVLGGGAAGETTVLNVGATQTKQITPHLIRIKNNENIDINKPVFRIGKEKSYVDYFIADNTAISRSHANIITREDKYFVLDTNSTNHTFVNGQMIPSSMEVEITHGTKLRFANEDFEFQLY